MYRLVIVEDERDVKNRLVNLIEKSGRNFEIISEYETGCQGDGSVDTFEKGVNRTVPLTPTSTALTDKSPGPSGPGDLSKQWCSFLPSSVVYCKNLLLSQLLVSLPARV